MDLTERLVEALERIAKALEKQIVTSYGAGDQDEPAAPARVRRRRIADRVEHWKATHPDWATDPIPAQGEITAATGIVSADSISKIRALLLQDQDAVRRCTESS